MSANPGRYVGEAVTLQRSRGGDIETVVTKVGRKYFWVEAAYHYQKFEISTGHEVTQYGSRDRVTTPEQAAEEKRCGELTEALRERGIEIRSYRYTYDSLALTRILAAIQGDDVDPMVEGRAR